MNKPTKIRGLFFVLAFSLLSMATGCSGEKEPAAIRADLTIPDGPTTLSFQHCINAWHERDSA